MFWKHKFFGVESWNSKFNFGILQTWGCGGQAVPFMYKLIVETQMCNAAEHASMKNQQNYRSFYPSEPFSFIHFNMIHPVFGFVVIGVHRKKSTKIQIFLLISESPATFWRLPYKTYFILIAIFCSYVYQFCLSFKSNKLPLAYCFSNRNSDRNSCGICHLLFPTEKIDRL